MAEFERLTLRKLKRLIRRYRSNTLDSISDATQNLDLQRNATSNTGQASSSTTNILDNNLTEIIMRLYKVSLEKAESMQHSLRNQKRINQKLADEEHRDKLKERLLSDRPIDDHELDDLIGLSDHTPSDFEVSEDTGLSSSELKQKLEALKSRIGDIGREFRELISNRVFQMERKLLCHFHDFHSLVVSNDEAALAKLQEFKLELEKLAEEKDGKVPVVVYEIISVIEMPVDWESGNADEDQHTKTVEETICKKIKVDLLISVVRRTIFTLHEIVDKLVCHGPPEKTISEASESCEGIFREAEECLKEIAWMIS